MSLLGGTRCICEVELDRQGGIAVIMLGGILVAVVMRWCK